MSKIRVLVVDDSATLRHYLTQVLARDPDIEVVGDASDGERAIAMCEALRPNVMTLDMVLPRGSGVEVTQHLMANLPTPILIVSSSTNRGELFSTYDALAAGAVDVLDKPSGEESDEAWEQRFVSTVKLVSRIRVIRRPHARLLRESLKPRVREPDAQSQDARSQDARSQVARGQELPDFRTDARVPEVIGIGASTGGPGALVEVLRALPQDFRLPVLIVLHIGAPFAAALSSWLEGVVHRSVRVAQGGERLATLAGQVLMAPPGAHMVVRSGMIRLNQEPERHSCRPSIDCLFETLAAEHGPRAVGCLLTGMGRDGAAGLLAMRKTGALTIAQDEATSVIYGMPREAAALGAAERVLSLPQIGPLLARLPSRASSREP